HCDRVQCYLLSFPTRRSSDLTLTVKAGSFAAASFAICSLLRTLPDRYSSAVFQFWSEGSWKITPRSSPVIHPKSSGVPNSSAIRSEEHTSELQSRFDLVYRLL